MLDQKQIADEFGYMGKTIYLNTCGVGLPPMRVQRAAAAYFEEYTRMLRDYGITNYEWLRQETRAQLARLVGGAADEIAFFPNTSSAVAAFASGYPIGPGENVITCDLENPCHSFPWFQAARQRGFTVRVIKTDGRSIPTEAVAAAMDAHTRVVALSAVQSGTGYFCDLKALAQLCHSRGAVLAVDAVQAVGRMAIDVEKSGVDFLGCGGFKGMLAGFGGGFSWCRRSLLSQISPAYAGVGGTNGFPAPPETIPDDSCFQLVADARRFEPGSTNSCGIALLHESASLMLELGIHEIEMHIRTLEDSLRRRLHIPTLEVVDFDEAARRSGIVVAYYPQEKYETLREALAERRIRLTHRPGYLRLCIGLYNTEAQMDALVEVLSVLA